MILRPKSSVTSSSWRLYLAQKRRIRQELDIIDHRSTAITRLLLLLPMVAYRTPLTFVLFVHRNSLYITGDSKQTATRNHLLARPVASRIRGDDARLRFIKA